MRIPYTGRGQFEEKAAVLASAFGLDSEEALTLLAHLSGYQDASLVETGVDDKALRFSREELIARLQAIRPDILEDRAIGVVDRLALPVRDTELEHIPASPDAVPNMGG